MTILQKINAHLDEYMEFMGIESFPEFTVQYHEVSQAKVDLQGFEVVASAFYEVINRQHTLLVSTNIELNKSVLFHEFTHMYDSELYVNNDKIRYMGLSGYTEYHASQVELAQLLGAETIDSIPSFSLNTRISTFAGNKSVLEYIQGKYQHAIDMFSRNDFPANIESLKSAFGILYNYWGLRSICEMYATDFTESINCGAFSKFISTMNFTLLNNLMHGWLDKAKIDKSIPLYINTIFPIIKTYNLA